MTEVKVMHKKYFSWEGYFLFNNNGGIVISVTLIVIKITSKKNRLDITIISELNSIDFMKMNSR